MITSRTNERIKAVRALQMNKERNRSGLHLAEGDKLVQEAICSGAQVETIFIKEGSSFALPQSLEICYVTESVMEAISTQKTPQDLCAVVRTPSLICPDAYPEGLILVLDRIQDPGNLGTILRTGDALGASGILLSDACADPFSPKCLRASMGSAYHLPVWKGDPVEEIIKMKQQGFICICGHLNGSEIMPVHGNRTALIIGNEGNGVSDAVAELCECYRFPMKGKAESLNAAVFAAILMYEILREG